MNNNRCRHFCGLWPDDKPSCKKGRDVRATATKCNGGSEFGIALRLPCTKQKDSTQPLFDCPDVDRHTDEEIAARKKAASDHIDKLIAVIPKLDQYKQKMIAKGLPAARATCPWCGEKGTLRLNVALKVNNHMHVHCTSCGEGLIE